MQKYWNIFILFMLIACDVYVFARYKQHWWQTPLHVIVFSSAKRETCRDSAPANAENSLETHIKNFQTGWNIRNAENKMTKAIDKYAQAQVLYFWKENECGKWNFSCSGKF